MTDSTQAMSRRAALTRGATLLAAIAVTVVGVQPAFAEATPAAGAKKKKGKAAKDDFYFQDTPDDSGKSCKGCINFTPKSSGLFGADSGDCALLEGDVCNHCYCQGWTDKRDAGAKKAGT